MMRPHCCHCAVRFMRLAWFVVFVATVALLVWCLGGHP